MAARGMRPALPALSGLVRILLHPGFLVGLILLLVLTRLGFPRRGYGRG